MPVYIYLPNPSLSRQLRGQTYPVPSRSCLLVTKISTHKLKYYTFLPSNKPSIYHPITHSHTTRNLGEAYLRPLDETPQASHSLRPLQGVDVVLHAEHRRSVDRGPVEDGTV